jgi:hypothetical protein
MKNKAKSAEGLEARKHKTPSSNPSTDKKNTEI